MKPGGLLVIDSDMVKGAEKGSYEILSLPATRIAEKEMGTTIVANLIILRALVKKTAIVPAQSMEKAIDASLPKKAAALNKAAFQRGLGIDI